MIELEPGDVVLINMETFRLVEGNPPSSARYLFASVKQCETFGCTNRCFAAHDADSASNERASVRGVRGGVVMYLVAHQDECQMVVGTPKAGTIQNIQDPLNGEIPLRYIVGTQQPRQCTCEPLLMKYWQLRHDGYEYPR